MAERVRCLHALEIGFNSIFLKDINTMICTLKGCVNFCHFFVAKCDNIDHDVFVDDAEFLFISDYLPQCDVIVELLLSDDGTYNEIDYNTYMQSH